MKPLETAYFKKLIKEDIGLAYTTIGGLGAAVLGALFWFVLASILNVDDYGVVNYYIALANIFAGIGTIGLNMTVTTYLAKGERFLLYEANSLALISGVIAALVLFVFQWVSGLLSVALIFFTMSLAEILGRKTYREYAFVSIGQRIAQICLSLILYFELGIIGIILGYFIGALLFSYKYLLSIRKFTLKINHLKEKRNFTIHSFGYNIVGQTFSNYIDKVIIGALFGYFALGLYQLGFQFFMFLNIIPTSLQRYLLPEESSGNHKRQIKLVGIILSVISSIATFAIIPFLVTNFFPTFTDAIPLVSILSLAVIPSTIVAILTASFLGKEKSKPVFMAGMVYLTSLIISLTIMGGIIGVLGLALAVISAKTLQAIYLIASTRNK
jgi:O-antigen/teichoic acid export membrane protein